MIINKWQSQHGKTYIKLVLKKDAYKDCKNPEYFQINLNENYKISTGKGKTYFIKDIFNMDLIDDATNEPKPAAVAQDTQAR